MMNIERFCERYNLGKVISIIKISGGLMHKMFKVETTNGIYCIKVLNKEVMSRSDAYNNFIVSENISNLANKSGIPVSSALSIDGNYINKLDYYYYMVFNYIDGKVLNDDEITTYHCKKIGSILGRLHNLDYKSIGLEPNIVEYKRLYDWESYINNTNFNNMEYRKLYLDNYKKYNSILKRANECFNESNINQTICHMDMDPKNVMWNNNPIVIDWECAKVANPERELLEDALCWSGFLSNNFDKDKFISVFKEYSKYRSINNIDWYDVICGNLVGRFEWLKYNLERSLGIISNDSEEINIASREVSKTINEINRYLLLIGTMYNLINSLSTNNKYDKEIEIIINNNSFLSNNYKLINSGFTNTIYEIDNYIVRICTDYSNEERFINEIEFYNKNKDNNYIPKLYSYDTSKSKIDYYYEVIEKIEGNTLYEVWYKLDSNERLEVVKKIIDILRTFHSISVKEYDFNKYIKDEINNILIDINLSMDIFDDLFNMCDIFFKENRFGIIHNDIHFDNFIYNNGNIKLIDFERYMTGSIDYDFKRLSMYNIYPWLWASANSDMLTVESDYQDLMNMFLDNYEELSSIPFIKERLEVYTIIELLYQYKNTKILDRLELVKDKIKVLGDKYVR